MGKPTGFLEFGRTETHERPIGERTKDYREIVIPPTEEELRTEGARCMDCGTPFCHSLGCPVSNLIPEWNDAVYRGQWREAWERLELTNNLPEVTGRVCPALCEASCTLAINAGAVSIKKMEYAVAERAFAEGWTCARPPERETGYKVAVIGSGPAGLAAAQQLRRVGHQVTVFEKSERVGGLLRYGIPDFKLEKRVLDRRISQMREEGVAFETGFIVGEDLSARYIRKKFDALVLALGAGAPRDLAVPGRELRGIHFALDFLARSNKFVSGEISEKELISAKGKHVLVIGGGDTGSDCVGTSIRQGAASVSQFEILPEPREWHKPYNPDWPDWPNILRTSSSHAEGCSREWRVQTQRFEGSARGAVVGAVCSRVEWSTPAPGERPSMSEIDGSQFTVRADLVLLAMGFVHVEHSRLLDDLGVELDSRGNIACDSDYMTSSPGVFAAGDAHSGASLVVRAIAHGRSAARSVDLFLSS